MIRKLSRNWRRKYRHRRVRRRMAGTPERPRLVVFRSNRHLYVQVVDDVAGHTMASASTLDPALRDQALSAMERARRVGELVAERARARGVSRVAFDRGGYKYHGRIAAVAEGAREKGLEF